MPLLLLGYKLIKPILLPPIKAFKPITFSNIANNKIDVEIPGKEIDKIKSIKKFYLT